MTIKWNNENKKKLYKALVIHHTVMTSGRDREEWRARHSVVQVLKLTRAWQEKKDGKWVNAQSKDRIIVGDPGGDRMDGLSIPKEVAEKFLVLGVP
jgi:hypothetical protein